VPRRQCKDPARFLERGAISRARRFPDLAHDDEVDACSGALEMLNPHMRSQGLFELYRREHEQREAQRSKPQPVKREPQRGSMEWFEAQKKESEPR